MTTKTMTGSQILNLYDARHKAGELTNLAEKLPAWAFEESDARELFQSLDVVRTILNTADEWRNLK